MAQATARLDSELVRRGLARSRRRASELVAQGHVRVAGAPARKPSQQVPLDEPVEILGSDDQYVSRAAYKLIGALAGVDALAPGRVRVTGSRCLDVGASTGGFTQVLLERGATEVVAVDVGHGQMDPVLAADPRVTVLEGVNARDLVPDDVGAVDLVVADLSFISLTLVVRPLLDLLRPSGTALLMVKPQFEVGRERLGASGVVSSTELRVTAVLGVASAAIQDGATVHAVVPSPLPGPAGNHEYFLLLAPRGVGDGPDGAAGVVGGQDGAEPHRVHRALPLRDAVLRAVRDDEPTLVRHDGARVRS